MRTTCPNGYCQAPLINLTSQNVKICVDCLVEYDNKLKPTEKPLIKATR